MDADPAIRWQVMQDLTDAPAAEVAAERAKVATEGWGAKLLALQPPNGIGRGAKSELVNSVPFTYLSSLTASAS